MLQPPDSVRSSFSRFLGLDLGGIRGKTTALAELVTHGSGAMVTRVALRDHGQPWTDDTLAAELLSLPPTTTAIAIDAPLTHHACGRCVRPTCPGAAKCDDPAVQWLRAAGQAAVPGASIQRAELAQGTSRPLALRSSDQPARARLVPYAHRATEVSLVEAGLLPLGRLGGANSPIAARARHLVRRLAGAGFSLHENLLEVSPQATVTALFGPRKARGRKRDADPWHTRAEILARLPELTFAPSSRLAREDVLRNDHCFDALISAYTAFRWAKDGWQLPARDRELFETDGWVWAPPPST